MLISNLSTSGFYNINSFREILIRKDVACRVRKIIELTDYFF